MFDFSNSQGGLIYSDFADALGVRSHPDMSLFFYLYRGDGNASQWANYVRIPGGWEIGEEASWLFSVTDGGHLRVFKNGKLMGESVGTGDAWRRVHRPYLMVGRHPWYGQGWYGSIRSIKIWEDTVLPEQVGSCSDYLCPAGYANRWARVAGFCGTVPCGPKDLQVCCQPCFTTGAMYSNPLSRGWSGTDMPGQGRTTEVSVLECQARCMQVLGCAHFTYWSDGGCHLQGSVATLREPPPSRDASTTGSASCTPQAGLIAEQFSGDAVSMPGSESRPLSAVFAVAQIGFSGYSGELNPWGSNNFTARWTGYIQIGSAGSYDFSASSPGGCTFLVDESSVIDGSNSEGLQTGTSWLQAGPHAVRFEVVVRTRDVQVTLSYRGPDTNHNQIIVPSSALWHWQQATSMTTTATTTLSVETSGLWQELSSDESGTKPRATANVTCPAGTALTGCACFGLGSSCDGAEVSNNTCSVYTAGGIGVWAQARCGYIPGSSDWQEVLNSSSAVCPVGTVLTGCTCHPMQSGCAGARIVGNLCQAYPTSGAVGAVAQARCGKLPGASGWLETLGGPSASAAGVTVDAVCPAGTTLTSCTCYAADASCAGARSRGNVCTAHSSGRGSGAYSQARCASMPGQSLCPTGWTFNDGYARACAPAEAWCSSSIVTSSIDACAGMCNSRPRCLSFSWDLNETSRCRLHAEPGPTSNFGQGLSVFSQTLCSKAWTRITHCSSDNSTERMDFPPGAVQSMAGKALRIKLCFAGSIEMCAVSSGNSFPIQMLRQAQAISHILGTPCDRACVAGVWAGPDLMLNQLWSGHTIGNASVWDVDSLLFDARGNPSGVKLGVHNSQPCEWRSGGPGVEVFIDVQ